MKATELLIKQHDETKAILKELEHGSRDAKKLVEKLASSLAAHMIIEQELFYPAVLAAQKDLVLEGYEEHACARFALKRLVKTPLDAQNFKARVTTLRELLEHHIKEEQEEMFPKAERALGDASVTLCAQMKTLFDESVAEGFAETLAPGGAAVTSANAPQLSA